MLGWLREKGGREVGAGTLGMRRAAQVREERGKRSMDRKENLRKEGIKGNRDEHCASPALASSEDSRKEKSTVRGSEVDGVKVGWHATAAKYPAAKCGRPPAL